MSPERKIGLAYVAARFHGGQYSRLYRILSRIDFRPGTDRAARLQPKEEWQSERDWAAHYTRWVRRQPQGKFGL